jgi:hypothetical protein
MQKTLVKCGFLAFDACIARRHRDALGGARRRSRRAPSRARFDENRHAKLFCITSLNRAVDDLIPIGIARIARLAIRMRIASRDREDGLRA